MKHFPQTSKPLSPHAILAGTFIIFLGPFLMVELFPAQLDTVIDKSSYLVFHNIAEFFSIMVSLSVFSVGWYTYDQSKDRHALFLGTAFLAVGLLDFMHTMSNAAMPAFITPNSTNKSTQFWLSARLLDSSVLMLSAYVYPQSQSRWLSKTALMASALAVTGLAFTGIVFFSSYVPATAVQGVGLTPLKRILEFVVIFLLIIAAVSYWKRMARTGDRMITYYLAAFIICVFSEGVFASYKTGFDTYNVLGHIYKVIAFYLIYKGIFTSAVKKPYAELSGVNETLLTEITERRNAEEKLRLYQGHLEELVKDRTRQMEAANENLQKDIAGRKKAEDELRRRTAELEAANGELEAFCYSVSHDLRAPLRGIDGFSQILLKDYSDRLDADGQDFLRRIHEATRRMSQLIDDLLNLSRMARAEMRRKRVNLSKLISQIADALMKTQPERKADFIVSEDLCADCDEHLLNVALENLVNNAWKFSGDRTHTVIEFGVAKREGKQAYFVKDNGAGFDMRYSDKLFSPFQRLHSPDEFPGTGIGLATVKRIINRHGGQVWIEGEIDKGTTVYFTL